MKIVLVPSSAGSSAPTTTCRATSSTTSSPWTRGGSGFRAPWPIRQRIRNVFLTHSHIDHIASLPIFLENVYGAHPEGVVVHGGAAVLDCLQRDVFNDRLMPDFIRISRERKPPFLCLSLLEEGKPVTADGLRVTPVSVDHAVPTFAFVIEGPKTAVAVVTDTAPTEAIWRRLRETPNLKAVFLEASFPKSAARMADLSGHLTSDQFIREGKKVGPDVQIIAVHLKPRTHDQVAAEVLAYRLPNVRIAEPGRVYEF